MNERIGELAEQATIQEGSHGAFGEPTINEYVDLEKFAELIVRECISAISDAQQKELKEGVKLNLWGYAYAIKRIEERFGIENET